MTEDIFKFSKQPRFERSYTIVGWNRDACQLSPRVIDFLNKRLRCKNFCEIEPADFFSLAGVAIEDDVAQFSESRFYYNQEKNLVILKASEPQFERYRFLSAILDVTEHHCRTLQLYTINGIISSIAHTYPRRILAVFNQPEIQKELRGQGLKDMSWQGPPAISSYLLWLAKRRNIAGVSLWTEMPFYLAAWEDFEAVKKTLSFLNSRFNLQLNFEELDAKISIQNEKLSQLRQQEPEVNKSIGALESGLSLSEEEQMQLIREVNELAESTS